MKKKKTMILLAALVVICLLAAGTLAYFTQEEIAHNTITTGGIDIDLIEKAIVDGKEVDFTDVDGVMPGMDVSKIVKVKNTCENPAYVRVSVEKSIELAKEVTGEPDLNLVTLNFNTEDWTDGGDGYWYYNKVLKAGETTSPLFTTVSFSTEMDNMYQGCIANVDVAAQAVQSANNGTDPLAAAGWPA